MKKNTGRYKVLKCGKCFRYIAMPEVQKKRKCICGNTIDSTIQVVYYIADYSRARYIASQLTLRGEGKR
jgi:PHP family Zn ribbon phosphoesterase